MSFFGGGNMKIFIRIMRTLLGVILLCAFGYGLYISAQTAPHASDFYAAAAQTPDAGAVPATPAQNETPASEQTAAPTDIDLKPLMMLRCWFILFLLSEFIIEDHEPTALSL